MSARKGGLAAVRPVPGSVVLTGRRELSVPEIVAVARFGAPVTLADEARAAIQASEAALVEAVRRGAPIYGLTTGVGALDAVPIPPAARLDGQRSLLRSHAAGVGAPMAEDQVRAMMLSRAHVLSAGMSGVSLAVVETLLAMLGRRVTPLVPVGGSVGASDLAPLAHLGLVLIGEGWALVDGVRRTGHDAMERAGIGLPELGGRDALALINGLDQTIAIGALAVHDAAGLVRWGEAIAALTIAASRAQDDFLDERLVRAKPHPGAMESARRMRALLGVRRGRGNPGPAREMRAPLSSRYAPHVLGASREALTHARDALQIEINSIVDNPLIGADGWTTSDAGCTSGQQLAEVLDTVASSLTALAAASERRTARLLDPRASGGLPAFLVHPRASNSSGLMIAQYTAASLVAELRCRAIPASTQSIPTCGGTEDQVSMSALSARRAAWAVDIARTVLAIELLAATQAADLRGDELPSALAIIRDTVRARVPLMIEDRVLADDIQAVGERIAATEAP